MRGTPRPVRMLPSLVPLRTVLQCAAELPEAEGVLWVE